MHRISISSFSIGIIYLFHLSALIGISLGYWDWFLDKTWINLLVTFALFANVYPIKNITTIKIASLIFIIGFSAEWLGVNFGLIFGSYSYGENLGLKIQGVPLLIGINWILLNFASRAISVKAFQNPFFQVLAASLLMVFVDILIEPVAPRIGFWTFSDVIAPFSNYIGWFLIAAIIQMILERTKTTGNFQLSLHLILIQIVFFGYLVLLFKTNQV